MITAKPLILLGALCALPAAALAEGEPVDTSKWLCKLCKFEDGTSGSVDVGAGNVSDKSAKFGEYTGLQKKESFFIGDGSLRVRGADATYWNVDASNLGLETRSLGLEGGRQGSYKLFLNYDELPHFLSDSARTPFLGSGGSSLTLPAGYPAATTGLMPLATTLQPLDLDTQRKSLGVGASLIPASGWEYGLRFRHETRDGTKRTSGAFFVNAAQLPEPVDYTTDQVDAWASYTSGKLQAKLAYYGSRFKNANDALTWQNPFTVPGFPAAVAGQLALAPDNQFHQLTASAGYQFTDRTRASADIAWGRMTQDQAFLAPTLNAALAVPALPGSSLDGHATTLNANAKLTSAVSDALRLHAAYMRDERRNETSQALYPWVTTDMFLGAPRTNLPYSFTQDRLKLGGDYRVSARLRASAGVDHDQQKRSFQETDETRETTLWGKASARVLDKVDLSLKLASGVRHNSGYQLVAAIAPPENPLLRKYNLANRWRDTAGLRADVALTDRISVGLGIDSANDRYKDSAIGLTSGHDYGLNGDVSALLSESTSAHLFVNHQVISSRQANSQAFANPDWSADNSDTVDLVGVGLRHALIKDKLELAADYTATRTRSVIRVDNGAGGPAFPNLATSLDSLKLTLNYRVQKNVSLLGGYWYERYRSDNWALDGVAPDTIPNLLALGDQPPRYRVQVLRVSVRYGF